jgi:putative integral membrane protein (TIGR02587 family)
MTGPFGIAYSPLRTVVESEDEVQLLWVKELRDLARGFCGALFVSLPLLYTQEMWDYGRLVSNSLLILFVLVAYFANVGYIRFEGFKPEPQGRSAWLDAFTVMGIGALASFITLFILGRFDIATPFVVVAKLVLVETIPTSFGASLALHQLGSREVHDYESQQPADRYPRDLRKILATTLGAFLFSFNIAPTLEPVLISYTISWLHSFGIILFSLFVSFLMVFFADFAEREEKSQPGILGPEWLETVVAYLISLAISALLLWLFGSIHGDMSLAAIVTMIVTLGYVTTLGGAAGRMIL